MQLPVAKEAAASKALALDLKKQLQAQPSHTLMMAYQGAASRLALMAAAEDVFLPSCHRNVFSIGDLAVVTGGAPTHSNLYIA